MVSMNGRFPTGNPVELFVFIRKPGEEDTKGIREYTVGTAEGKRKITGYDTEVNLPLPGV
jgi:hypothetical protein